MDYVGSMFIETENGVVEIGMIETPDGVIPGGCRDAITHDKPRRFPTMEQFKEAIQLAKWAYLNQAVFEGKVSNVSLAEWDVAGDTCANDALRDDSENN